MLELRIFGDILGPTLAVVSGTASIPTASLIPKSCALSRQTKSFTPLFHHMTCHKSQSQSPTWQSHDRSHDIT